MASFMEVLQTSLRSQKLLYHRLLAVYIKATFSCRAATKEIQRVIDTINDGILYLRGSVCIGTYTL